MKLLSKSYFLAGMTRAITLDPQCTRGAAKYILVEAQGLNLNDRSRIIVTPYYAERGQPLAVVTATQIMSPNHFLIFARNVDCVRSGLIKFGWTVFNEDLPVVGPPVYFRMGEVLSSQIVGNRCNFPIVTWETGFLPSDWRKPAYHVTNRSTNPYAMIATGCVRERGPLSYFIDAFDMEDASGGTSFDHGVFFRDPAPAGNPAYRIHTGVTGPQSFRRGQKKSWSVTFEKTFASPPTVFLGAQRISGELRTAPTAPSVKNVSNTGFSFVAIDCRCKGDDALLKTRYYWVAVGL